MRVFENRGAAVLYYFLKGNNSGRPFLLPANVCPIVPLTFFKAGVPFEFVDIDETHAMCRSQCIDRISHKKYGGILFVHAYGRIFDNGAFYRQFKTFDPSLLIIDDKCLCRPRLTDEVPADTDLELYSTGYAKYIEFAYGGWGIVNDCLNYIREPLVFREEVYKELMEYLRLCLNKGCCWDMTWEEWLDGSVFRESVPAYLQKIAFRLAEMDQHKECLNGIYEKNLPKEIQWGKDYNSWRFMINIINREKVLAKIFEAGLFAGTNFPSVSYLFGGISLPHAEEEQKRVMNLFNDFRVDEEFAYKVCDIINRYATF